MSQDSQYLPFPKLTDQAVKSLDSQISNLEILCKMQSRIGKLPKLYQEGLQPLLDDLTSVQCKEQVQTITPSVDQGSLILLMKQWNEFALAEFKEQIQAIRPYHKELTLSELMDMVKDTLVGSPEWAESFLDMFHTFCEKSQRSPESPQ